MISAENDMMDDGKGLEPSHLGQLEKAQLGRRRDARCTIWNGKDTRSEI